VILIMINGFSERRGVMRDLIRVETTAEADQSQSQPDDQREVGSDSILAPANHRRHHHAGHLSMHIRAEVNQCPALGDISDELLAAQTNVVA
jgi:hypothetical protein